MPEQTIIFRDRYEVTADDLNNAQIWRQDSLDDVVLDTIEANNRYSGFAVTAPTTTNVLIAPGRLYYGGKVYFNNTSGGTTIDLSTLKPALQSKYIAIVAAPLDQQTDLEERDFEIDTTTQTFEPQTVAMQQQRWASLQAVGGIEAVSPIQPTVPNTAVVIAYVLMTPGGIATVGGVTQVTANLVPNLDDVGNRTTTLESDLAAVQARTLTISDEIANILASIAGLANLTIITSLAQDVAHLKTLSNLPANYVNFRENDFFDATNSDPTYSGYTAKTAEGLRFDDEAVNASQLALFNPFDPLAKVSGGGVMLPTYTTEMFRIVQGNSGTMSLTQYSFQTYSLVQATMSRQRIRYGAEFEEALGSAFFVGGTFADPGPLGVASTFEKNGETFQVYDTGQVNPDGQEIVRLANYWLDTVTTPYWQRLVTEGSATGFAWCQTWVQDQSGWCLGIAPKISAKPATGTLTIGICGTVNGQPDLTNIIAQVTLNAADVVVNAPLGTWTVPIEPTYLQSGGRYGYFLITQAQYSVDVADIESNGGGTSFYALDGGVFFPNPSQNIMFDLAFASFTQNRVSIQLGSLSLSGGIAAIDILANTIVPANTVLTWEVQPQGSSTWFALGETSASVLAALPPLVFLRATMTGTANLMPGLTLSGSVCTLSRPKTVFKQASLPETLASASSKVTIKSTLIDYDPAHHTFHAKVLAGGTLQTPDTETPVVQDARTVVVTSVFNLAAPVTSYVSELDGTTDNAANLFHVASTFELAA